MNRTTSSMRSLAKRLIAYETDGKKISTTKTATAFHVSERLRPQLATLMGTGGFRALQARALALAHTEAPWLRTVQVKADGSLEGVEKLKTQITPAQLAEGKVVLLAQLLELLVAFIGEDLTLRLIQESWPEMALDDPIYHNGSNHEKSN